MKRIGNNLPPLSSVRFPLFQLSTLPSEKYTAFHVCVVRVIVFNIFILIVLFNSYLLLAIKEYVAGFRAVVRVHVFQ